MLNSGKEKLKKAGTAVNAARVRLVGDLAKALARLVGVVSKPALFLAVAAILLAVLLAILSLALGGPAAWAGVVLAVLGVLPALWLLWRRRQLTRAVDPPEELAAELHKVYDLTDAWSQAREALDRVRAPGRGARRAARAVRGLWTGVRIGRDVTDRLGGLDRVAPFLPLRLRTTAMVVAATAISVVAMSVLAVAAALVLVFTAFAF